MPRLPYRLTAALLLYCLTAPALPAAALNYQQEIAAIKATLASITASDASGLTTDLASSTSGKGAALVATRGGGTVADALPWVVSPSPTDAGDAAESYSLKWAITQARAAGARTVVIPPGANLTLTTPIEETFAADEAGLRIVGYGATITSNVSAEASKSVTSITHSYGTATVTATAHGYAVGDMVKIAGADQLAYNGVCHVATVPTADTFTTKLGSKTATSATGTITVARVPHLLTFTSAAGSAINVKNFSVRGLTFVGNGSEGGAIKIDGGAQASSNWTYHWDLADLYAYHVAGANVYLTGNFFESRLVNVNAVMDRSTNPNVNGYGMLFDHAASGTISSIQVLDCNTSGGRNGLYAASPVSDIRVTGGTYLLAQQEGIYLANGGQVLGPHVEENWQTTHSADVTDGAGVYVGAKGSIQDVYAITTSSNQEYAVRTYATGEVTVSGGIGSGLTAFAYVAGSGAGAVSLVGVPDYTSTAGPAVLAYSAGVVDGEAAFNLTGDFATAFVRTPQTTLLTITAATDTITFTGSWRQLSSDADYTMSSTPTIAAGTDGADLWLFNSGNYTITLQDSATLGSSLLGLVATTQAIPPNGSLHLKYSQTRGKWMQVGPVVDAL